MSNETNPHEEIPIHADSVQEEPIPDFETLPEILDPEPAVGGAPNPADLIALLQENLDLTKKLEEAQRSELYVQAEYQNYRRQSEKRSTDMQKYHNAEFIIALLPVLDNFERAMAAAEQSQNLEALVSGVKGTHKQLQSALQKAGVTTIEAVGKEFDPKYHEAIGNVESDAYPSNTVAEEVQRGYVLHDRVLRPTLVRVTD
jgi:molecular chaperone GrpE